MYIPESVIGFILGVITITIIAVIYGIKSDKK